MWKWWRAVLLGAGLGAGLGVLGLRALLRRQAAIARRLIGKPLGEQALDADRVWRPELGSPWHLVVLGDSIAAGLGADKPKHTLGARLAKGLAKASGRAVRLTTLARVGAESSDLAAQLARLPSVAPVDVAVIVVGGNDLTHRVPIADSVAALRAAIDELRHRGAEVVVGTCPDLRAVSPVPQPLRSLGSRAARQLAAAQQAAALAAGARAVSLAAVAGPFFEAAPDEMFSVDRFHPSSAGYRRTAKAMLPSVLAAVGDEQPDRFGHHAPGAETAPVETSQRRR
ncbi:SGNH/GDSL hydrolase family protein [Nocardioides sp. Bht2]|uniref:SGNH/GDSL hydrolase family protein n=1 Tax=Nocardioides sp. Bht2 TaxID=3392297 RepID=UPI0039B6E46B